ncbi:hypothetical protein [Anabaena azotica]|uniref:hypothetical protein n=1 Tax=Anabaena azotica TaxID=197653 RepID=UPI0039A57A9B
MLTIEILNSKIKILNLLGLNHINYAVLSKNNVSMSIVTSVLFMTKPNSSGVINQTPKISTWPVWFPYPSSWLKAIILALFIGIISFVFTNTEEWGYKIASFTNSLKLLLIFRILAILSPIVVITFTHHIFHIIISQFFPKIQAPEIGKPKEFIPGIVSIWEGLYGWMTIWLSTLISIFLISIVFPIPNLILYDLFEFYSEFEEILIAVIGCTWIITSALIYQIDFLFKRRLLSVSSATYKPNTNLPSSPDVTHSEKATNANSVDVEMNNLRGSMGLTEMKSAKKSPTTSQSSNVTSTDNFQQAVNLAKNAAQLTRIAKTKAEWHQVGIEWQKTIEILKTVPTSSSNYAAAQQKILDYQKYLNYAKKIVNSKHINN